MDAVMTLGVSASGKSSLAAMYYDDYHVVERDVIRFQMLPTKYTGWRGRKPYVFSQENEAMVTAIQHNLIKGHIHMGDLILLSDTWLNKKNRRAMYKTLQDANYSVKVLVVNVPLKVAIERDSYRGNLSVGESIIRQQWDKLQGAKSQLIGEVEKYGISVVEFNNFGNYEGKENL